MPAPTAIPAALTMQQIRAAIIADTAPLSESTTPQPGDPVKAQAAGHQHPRMTSATYVTTAANGQQTATFTRSFAAMPCPVLSAINNPGVTCDVASWVRDGSGNYTGAVIRATKRTAGATSGSATVLSVAVLTSVTPTTADTPVAGQLVSVVMLQQSVP